MNKKSKILLFIVLSILAVIIIVIVFISPITKYLIQKYDEKYTGRQITLDWAYVNPFTGYIHLQNLNIYELKSDSVFFTANGISANFSIYKMLSQTYEISQLTLNHPKGIIIQIKKVFNFSDLIELFSPKQNVYIRDPLHFNILNFNVIAGEFHFHEKEIPVNYFIKNVNLKSKGKQWDSDTISATFSFLPGIGTGVVKGNFTINLETHDYRCAVVARKLDLSIIDQYLKDIINYGSFRAHIDVNVKANGNFDSAQNITASGNIAVNEFHFGKNPDEDYASFDKLVYAFKEISPQKHKYLIDSIFLSHPYLKFERYDHLNNVETIFGVNGANIESAKSNSEKFNLVIEIAKYLRIMARNFFLSDYKINRVRIFNGDLKYNDYSLREKFSVTMNPLNISADSIYKDYKWIKLNLSSGIRPFGELETSVRINPKDSSDFDLNYKLNKVPVSLFNPYAITYTSFPLDKGTIEVDGAWTVRDGLIQSTNHLIIIDPRLAKRLKNKDVKHLPLPLILAFIREKGNVIDYEIPITGDLKDPKFHLWDVISDLLTNIFIKPPTTPYRLQVKSVEREIEKAHALTWAMQSTSLTNQQNKYVEKIAEFLEDNPSASVTITPKNHATKEKEFILFYEAKKEYFLSAENNKSNRLKEDDSLKIERFSVKDSSFNHYLDSKAKDSLLFTVQDKCSELITASRVNQQFKQLNDDRKKTFNQFFEKGDLLKRVHFATNENVVPYNGFSFYEIKYNGNFPQSLLKAYEKMNELDSMSPRAKYRKERNGKPM